jgi:nitrogen fixation NifU-like protein
MTGNPEIRDLYPEVILDHSRHPRNRRTMAGCSHAGRSENPSCGDEVVVFLDIDDRGVIGEIAFGGRSCAIATASASLMTEVLVGKTPAQAEALFHRFRAIACGGVDAPLDGMEVEVERLTTLAGLRDYPAREKCATLPWHTMLVALQNPKERK